MIVDGSSDERVVLSVAVVEDGRGAGEACVMGAMLACET